MSSEEPSARWQPLDRVASLLGHKSVDTTRIYTTPSEQDLQREVEKVAMV